MKIRETVLTWVIYPYLDQEDEVVFGDRDGYIEVVRSRILESGEMFGKISLRELGAQEKLLTPEKRDQLIAALNKAKELTEEVAKLKP